MPPTTTIWTLSTHPLEPRSCHKFHRCLSHYRTGPQPSEARMASPLVPCITPYHLN